jgi:flagellar FliL protein
MPILSKIGAVFNGLVMLSMFCMNGLMGYIMFAPDDLPKPFYLSYAGDVPAILAQAMEGDGEPAGAEEAPLVEIVYEPGQGVMVETGTKIVNLADPGGRRYLKAGVTIEVSPPVEAEGTETPAEAEGEGGNAESPEMVAFNDKMSNRMPIINDIVTTVLSAKTFEEVYTVEGKESLRQEILTQLNERLPDLKVIAVYFTEFVVQ